MKSHDEKAMNANRAREVFSEIHEGVADAHTRKVFERALEQDPELRQEYAEFVRAMELLSDMGATPVEVPADLHEIISARVDRHVWEAGQAKKRRIWGLPSWAVGGLATVAVAASLVAVVARSNQSTGIAGITPVPPSVIKVKPAKAEFTFTGGQVRLSVSADRAVSVTVKRSDSDVVEGKYDVVDTKTIVDAPLINKESDPVALTVRFSDGQTPMFIVLPGTERNSVLTGEGDLNAVAKAVAGHFGTPVILTETANPKTYSWTFNADDTADDVRARLIAAGVGVEILPTGLLRISP